MEKVNITIAGQIGYLLKYQKMVNVNAQKDGNLSNVGESRLKLNNYRFIYQIT